MGCAAIARPDFPPVPRPFMIQLPFLLQLSISVLLFSLAALFLSFSFYWLAQGIYTLKCDSEEDDKDPPNKKRRVEGDEWKDN